MEAQVRKRLKRWEARRRWRFLTFTTHRRLQLFGTAAMRSLMTESLSAAKARCGFLLHAWVVMPEHVHLILAPTSEAWPVPKILIALKQPVAQKMLKRWRELDAPILSRLTADDGRVRFWQAGGGFDRLIRDADELSREKNYINENPVKRGLVESPTDWAWSSARWWAGREDGQIPIDRRIGEGW